MDKLENRLENFWTIPNILSLFRISFTPFIIYLLSKGNHKIYGFLLLLLAYTTDLLDGFLARTYNQKSKYGMILDPLADKFLSISLTVLLTIKGVLEIWFSLVLIVRDLCLVILGVIVVLLRKSVVEADAMGKVSAFLVNFILFLGVLLLLNFFYIPPEILTHYKFLQIISVILIILSGANYIIKGLRANGVIKKII